MADYIVDVTIISVILGFAIMGFISGFTGKVLSLMSWVFAIAIAFYCFPYVAPFANQYISSEIFADIAAFGGVFLLVLIVFIWISKTLSSTIKKGKLGSIDRNLGILLGIVVGVFFLSVVVLGMRFVIAPGDAPAAISHSKFFPWLETCADQVCSLLPATLVAHTQRDLTDQERVYQRARDEAAVKLAMMRPKPSAKNAAPEKPAYKPQERTALNNLFEKVAT